MLISFSVDSMLPYVVRGIRQYHGENVGSARVKRQTIRRRGPRAEALLLKAPAYIHDGSLHLWWKSRTRFKTFLGKIDKFGIYPIEISNIGNDKCIVVGPGETHLSWTDKFGGELKDFAFADGFDSLEEFRDYFVPNKGDVFNGVMYKW